MTWIKRRRIFHQIKLVSSMDSSSSSSFNSTGHFNSTKRILKKPLESKLEVFVIKVNYQTIRGFACLNTKLALEDAEYHNLHLNLWIHFIRIKQFLRSKTLNVSFGFFLVGFRTAQMFSINHANLFTSYQSLIRPEFYPRHPNHNVNWVSDHQKIQLVENFW